MYSENCLTNANRHRRVSWANLRDSGKKQTVADVRSRPIDYASNVCTGSDFSDLRVFSPLV